MARFFLFVLSAALLAAIALGASAPGVLAQDARLAPGDRVSIRVLQRPDLDGEFEISADGTISIHLVEDLPAAGLNTSDLDDILTETLSGMLSTDISVLVLPIRLRDVYIFGDVVNPGAYPYRPGLNVVQLLALGGGTSLLTDAESDIIPSGPLEIGDLERQLADILAERARLEAQRDGLEEIVVSDELQRVAGGVLDEIVSAQNEILANLRADRESFDRANAAQSELAERETEIHAARLEVLTTQLEEREAELTRNSDLRAQGLITEERLAQARANLRTDRSDLLAVTIAQSRANRDLADLAAARSDRDAEAALRISDRLADLAERERGARYRLGLTTRSSVVSLTSGEDSDGGASISMSLVRATPAEVSIQSANLGTFLEPGDVIEVRILPAVQGTASE